MSAPRRPPRPASANSGQAGLQLAEAAAQLLRRAPAGTWLAYLVGTVPFLVGLLYFIGEMSQAPEAARSVSPDALLLALLYLWMKCWQSVFATRLADIAADLAPSPFPLRRVLRLVARQCAWQPLGLLLRPVAMMITLPYGWTFAFFEHGTVLGAEPEARGFAKMAAAHAQLWPGQNHVMILLVRGFSLFVWANMIAAAWAVPFLLKTLLGVETNYSMSMMSLFNSTLFAVTFALTHLVIDPIFKAAYVLRSFRAEATRSGADLRAELRRLPKLALAAAFVWLAFAPWATAGAPPTETPAPAPPNELSHRIDSVLARREFAWRLPQPKESSRPSRFLEDTWKAVVDWFDKVTDWITKWRRKLFPEKRDAAMGDGGGSGFLSWLGSVEGIVWALLGVTVVVLAGLIWRAMRFRRQVEPTSALPADVMQPDLEAEEVAADALPEDDWGRLARELAAKGELRLALRAWYLAGLAHLSRRELIAIARAKSNREYERELQRRARNHPEVLAAFGESRRVFERTWYGWHEVTAEALEKFAQNFERLRAG